MIEILFILSLVVVSALLAVTTHYSLQTSPWA